MRAAASISEAIRNFLSEHGLEELVELVRAVKAVLRAFVRLVRRPFRAPAVPAAHLRLALSHGETHPLTPPGGCARPDSLSLNWVIPDFIIGAGGHMTIFRIVKLLEDLGHHSTLWILSRTQHGSPADAKRVIRDHFVSLNANVRVLDGNLDQITGDAVIATDWKTAYPVRAIRNVRHRFYFVQDFEPSFHPMGSEYLLAESTYRFGFTCITAGAWLESMMRERGAAASRFDLAVDRKVYSEDLRTARSPNRVAFYARSVTPRRAVELGLLALDVAGEMIPNLQVDFFGGRLGRMKVPYEYVEHGILSHADLALLYRRATLGMVFSATNYSLIPHEMMACGLPVLDLLGKNTESVFPRDVIALAPPDPTAIARQIETLLTDHEVRAAQVKAARAYVHGVSWEESARAVERVLLRALNCRGQPSDRPAC